MMDSNNLKSAKSVDKLNTQSDQINSNSFSQSANNLNKETTFIQSKNGPSVLLKNNISNKDINDDLFKLSKSTSYLAPQIRPVDSNDTKFLSNYSKFNGDNYLTSSPNVCKKPSNFLLAGTPNSFYHNESKHYDLEKNQSQLIEIPTLGENDNCLYDYFPPAILVKNVSFNYRDTYIKTKNVLKNVNLNCSIGSIYGLLGPSGCGKTTLIKLMLGKFRPSTGEIKAFGFNVESKYSGMAGSGVGYMPQETALIFDFTIEEHLTYFGRLYFMPYKTIRKRIDYICRILDLPEKTRLIHQLSGGQKHRVSFACALIHEPRLLILDEPTVGLDPNLRERIWYLLLSMSKSHKPTILITTHYIEEAKRADMIGFLRDGRMLIEQTPAFFMEKYESTSLEHIFFLLCKEQQKIQKTKRSEIHLDVNFNNSVNEMIEMHNPKSDQNTPSTSTS